MFFVFFQRPKMLLFLVFLQMLLDSAAADWVFKTYRGNGCTGVPHSERTLSTGVCRCDKPAIGENTCTKTMVQEPYTCDKSEVFCSYAVRNSVIQTCVGNKVVTKKWIDSCIPVGTGKNSAETIKAEQSCDGTNPVCEGEPSETTERDANTCTDFGQNSVMVSCGGGDGSDSSGDAGSDSGDGSDSSGDGSDSGELSFCCCFFIFFVYFTCTHIDQMYNFVSLALVGFPSSLYSQYFTFD